MSYDPERYPRHDARTKLPPKRTVPKRDERLNMGDPVHSIMMLVKTYRDGANTADVRSQIRDVLQRFGGVNRYHRRLEFLEVTEQCDLSEYELSVEDLVELRLGNQEAWVWEAER